MAGRIMAAEEVMKEVEKDSLEESGEELHSQVASLSCSPIFIGHACALRKAHTAVDTCGL